MGRLIRKDNQGNWHLKGVPWERLRAGVTLDKATTDRIYGALCKLMAYEDTGLEPAEVVDVNEFEKAQTVKLLKKLAEEREKHRWIPVEERLPGDEGTLVLVQLSGRPDTNVTLIDSIELATYCEGGWILKGWFQWDEAKPVA